MGKGNSYSAGLLALLFQGVTIPNIAQNVVSAPLTQLWVALHTANPGAGGAQNTNEAAYGSYARVAVNRNSGGWSLAGETITPVSNITFPQATSGVETETYFSIGTSQTGAGEILYSGPITPPISVQTGVAPVLLTGTSVTES